MKEGMMLSQLLEDLTADKMMNDVYVTGIENDSRRVASGDLFLAYQGHSAHGMDFLAQAVERGAVAVAHDATKGIVPELSLPTVTVADLNRKMSVIANRFYAKPSLDIPVIAVTGTDGKTSVSHFIAEALDLSGKRCGLVGTLGARFLHHTEATVNTTPDALFIQRFTRKLQTQGGDYLVLEASSHGIAQGRLDELAVDVAVFTNIGQDHTDYHQSIEEYVATKCKLFSSESLHYAIINRDSEYRNHFIEACSDGVQVLEYSSHDSSADAYLESLSSDRLGLDLRIRIDNRDIHLQSRLLGDFNGVNIMAALLALYTQGMDPEEAAVYLAKVNPVRGRMEAFHCPNHALVILDYAHTPYALQKVLDTCRSYCQGKLICVFGCGGDRDHQKRPLMGEIAAHRSDRVIITDDNPRTEDPDKIICDIQSPYGQADHVKVIRDRREAIEHAISTSEAGDVIVVAGKGHETIQIIGTESLPFNDAQVIGTAIRKL